MKKRHNQLTISVPQCVRKLSLVHTVPVYARYVTAVCSRQTGANRDELWRYSSVFIYYRQCYEPDLVWGKK